MEIIDGLDFDAASLRAALRPLVPHYRRFAVADDVEREHLIQQATADDLQQLVQAVNPRWPEINAFLAQAAMEAQIELKARAL